MLELCDQFIAKISLQVNSYCSVGWGGWGQGVESWKRDSSKERFLEDAKRQLLYYR